MSDRSDIREVEALVNKLRGPEAVFYGLDIGRVQDHSALSINVRYILPIDTQLNMLLSKYFCVYLKRYPLMTPYEIVEADVANWWRWADALGLKRYFVADATGVGAPVVEGIKKRRVRVISVNITGGNQESNPAIDQYNVPKATLATQFLRTAQTGRFVCYKSVQYAHELKSEMDTFGYEINKTTGAITYESLDQKVHDDLVVSVALPVWYGERVVPYRMTLRGSGAEVAENDYDPFNPQPA